MLDMLIKVYFNHLISMKIEKAQEMKGFPSRENIAILLVMLAGF